MATEIEDVEEIASGVVAEIAQPGEDAQAVTRALVPLETGPTKRTIAIMELAKGATNADVAAAQQWANSMVAHGLCNEWIIVPNGYRVRFVALEPDEVPLMERGEPEESETEERASHAERVVEAEARRP